MLFEKRVTEDDRIENEQHVNADNIDTEDLWTQRRIKRYEQDTTQRKWLTWWMVGIDTTWIVFIIITVTMTGCGVFELSSSVLCTLFATTTINIIGLAYIILKGLFKKK